jgi:hypothetical protein
LTCATLAAVANLPLFKSDVCTIVDPMWLMSAILKTKEGVPPTPRESGDKGKEGHAYRSNKLIFHNKTSNVLGLEADFAHRLLGSSNLT